MIHEVYRISDNASDNLPFTLMYITHSEYGKNWHSTPHSHHFTELFYIISGVGSFILPNREIPVRENDLVVINPNIEHTEKSDGNDSLEYIALGIHGLAFSFVPDGNEANEAPLGLFTYQGDKQEIPLLINKLLIEAQQKSQDYELICKNIINILIIELRRAKNVMVEKQDSIKLNKSIALVKHYINQSYQNQITLELLAKIGNVNKYYLAHLFKKEVGVSPIEYLNNVRIEEAKGLLKTTDFTIAMIADSSGFSSQSMFSQTFKRFTNQTPTSYRKETHSK